VKLNLSWKLILVFALLVVLLFAVGFFSLTQLETVAGEFEIQNSQVLPITDQVRNLSDLRLRQEMACRTYIYTGKTEYRNDFEFLTKQYLGKLSEVKERIHDGSGKQLVMAVETAFDDYVNRLREAINLREQGHSKEANQSLETTLSQYAGDLNSSSNQLSAYLREWADKSLDYVRSGVNRSRIYIMVALSGAIILAAFFGLGLTFGIGRALSALTNGMKHISSGDYSQRVEVETGDELERLGNSFNHMCLSLSQLATLFQRVAEGDLAQKTELQGTLASAVNQMIDRLRLLINHLQDTIYRLSSSASEIAATALQQERSITSQASAISQITTSVEELNVTSQQSTQKAEAVTQQSMTALQASQRGEEAVDRSKSEMESLKEKMEAIAEQILDLSEQSSQIGVIISTVSDIANQTNLLALNAAVEAARAGEQGKGFAVVAGEIRKLADQSRHATERIAEIVADIQKATNSTVMVTEEGAKGVEASMRQTIQAGEVIRALANNVEEAVAAVKDISITFRQQALGVDQISEGMVRINQGMQDTVMGISQTKVAADNLKDLAGQIKERIFTWRVAEDRQRS